MFKKIAIVTAALGAVFLISSCNDDGTSAQSAPGAPASMAGSTFSFNPTVELTDGTNFSYVNTDVASTLPAGPITGTYTFTRNSNTQVTITLNGPGIGGPAINTIDYVLTNFRGSTSSITSFDVNVNGSAFNATVTSGTVTSAPRASGSIPNDPNNTRATINPNFVGTHVLTYYETQASPLFTDGEQVTFEITSDGQLQFQGRTLTGAFFNRGNEFEVIWFDGTYGYAASGLDSLNEINIAEGYDYLASDFSFLGQFNDRVE